MQQGHPDAPGLLARIADPSGAKARDPLVRTLELALQTRPGETLGAPCFGLPCFADLVHGDKGSVHALRTQLGALLRQTSASRRGLEIKATLDREAAALRIEIIDRADPAPGPLASATINALGIPELRAYRESPDRSRAATVVPLGLDQTLRAAPRVLADPSGAIREQSERPRDVHQGPLNNAERDHRGCR